MICRVHVDVVVPYWLRLTENERSCGSHRSAAAVVVLLFLLTEYVF